MGPDVGRRCAELERVIIHARSHFTACALVTLALLVYGCTGIVRTDATLTPGDLAGETTAVEWELLTRFGERASPRRVADPRILACLLRYLKEAKATGLPGKENWAEYNLSFELRDGREVRLRYLVRDLSRCDPGYLEFPQGWYEVPGQFNILMEALTEYPDGSGDVDPQDEAFLRRYGWTPAFRINTLTVTLPAEFRHRAGEYPVVLYWAYNNELNRDVGLDLTPALGRAVEVRMYKVAEALPEFMRPRREAGRAVIVRYRGEIVGAWLDAGRHWGFACSLRGRSFEEVTGKTWEEWIPILIDPEHPVEKELSRLSPDALIRRYFQAVNAGDHAGAHACESRRALAGYLFRNMDNRSLYNSGYPREGNIAGFRVISVARAKHLESGLPTGTQCYQVVVDVETKEPIAHDSRRQQFFVEVRCETDATGWRIECIGTGP